MQEIPRRNTVKSIILGRTGLFLYSAISPAILNHIAASAAFGVAGQNIGNLLVLSPCVLLVYHERSLLSFTLFLFSLLQYFSLWRGLRTVPSPIFGPSVLEPTACMVFNLNRAFHRDPFIHRLTFDNRALCST